jgi:hypothetical protein
MSAQVKTLCRTIESLQARRYPTLLVLQSDAACLPDADARSFSDACGLRFVDYRSDVLEKKDSGVVLGAYSRDSFLRWLRENARTGNGLVVLNADDLIATWDDLERRAFFQEFLHTESNHKDDPVRRAPIVILSWLAASYVSAGGDLGRGIALDLTQLNEERATNERGETL